MMVSKSKCSHVQQAPPTRTSCTQVASVLCLLLTQTDLAQSEADIQRAEESLAYAEQLMQKTKGISKKVTFILGKQGVGCFFLLVVIPFKLNLVAQTCACKDMD